MVLDSVLDCAHRLASCALDDGDLAIDATVGSGHDTLFLARQIGAEGRVVGFDVQEAAIEATRQRLDEGAPDASVTLVEAGHETMPVHLDTEVEESVGAIMFNLGYLPGGDHALTTTPDTTRRALEHSARLIRTGGVITIVAYSGHDPGAQETTMVRDWTASLPQDTFQSLSYRFVNQTNDPPRLFAVEKIEESA